MARRRDRTGTSACARTSRCTTSSRPGTRVGPPRRSQALHDGDDGPVPGGAVLATPRGARPAKGAGVAARGRTTARPPVRAPRLGDLIGGVHEAGRAPDRRCTTGTSRPARGSTTPVVGSAPAPTATSPSEIRAVRERVSLMDVSTLGKFLVAGRDARVLLDWVFPLDVGAVAPGRARYLLALDEAGYVMDDGLLAALPDGSYYVTSTSGGADRMEAWLRNWIDRLEPARAPRQPDGTARRDQRRGAARTRPARYAVRRRPRRVRRSPTRDTPRSPSPASRAARSRSASSASCPSSCTTHAAGASSCGMRCVRAGRSWDVAPHGLDALDVLRLEKGHVYLAQDTMPDDHPAKLGLGWAVATDKPAFVGKRALERMDALPLERRLVGLRFDGPPQRGHPLAVDGAIVGRITSCAVSEAVGGPDRTRLGPGDRRRLPRGTRMPATSPLRRRRRPSTTPTGVRLRA